jgi:hypothetical protein
MKKNKLFLKLNKDLVITPKTILNFFGNRGVSHLSTPYPFFVSDCTALARSSQAIA